MSRRYVMGIDREDLITAIAAWIDCGEQTTGDGVPLVDDLDDYMRGKRLGEHLAAVHASARRAPEKP